MFHPRPPCNRNISIFTLVQIHGRTYAEVARQLGIKPKSVADICSKVRTWLRRMQEIQERIELVREVRAAVFAELAGGTLSPPSPATAWSQRPNWN